MSNIENENVSKDVIYDENNGLYYTQIGDYYYPNIVVDDTEKITLGKYGRARLKYLKEYKKGLYTELLMTGKLTEHLQRKIFLKQKIYKSQTSAGYNAGTKSIEEVCFPWNGATNNSKNMHGRCNMSTANTARSSLKSCKNLTGR